jgi:DNA-binding MarR family transcriptional regulator
MAEDTTLSKEERIKKIHDTFMLLMRISKRWFIQQLQSFGLTLPQFVNLAVLTAHKQPCIMSDLTAVTFQDPPTTTGVIDRLVKLKLVERARSETDRRVVLVQATPAGIKLIEEIEQKLMQEALTCYTVLTDEELTTLEQLLERLIWIHLGRVMPLPEVDLAAEIEKLSHFMKDPIYYMKLEHEKRL